MAAQSDFSINIPALQFNGQTIPSGINFDMQMPNLSELISQSFGFVQSVSAGNQAFVQRSINQSQQLLPQLITQTEPLYQYEASAAASNAQSAIAGEQSAASKSGSFCFITTALCEYEHKPDDCIELQKLRRFRDTYMQETDDRKMLVSLYYRIGPVLVSRIGMLDALKRDCLFNSVRVYIRAALVFIDSREHSAALSIYARMLEYVAGVVK